MQWKIEHTIAIISAFGTIAAATAAWFSYQASRATLNTLLNKEKPVLNLESIIRKGKSSEPDKVHLTLENFGSSYAKIEKLHFIYSGTHYDATNKESIDSLKQALALKLAANFKILEFKKNEWRIGCDKYKNLIVVTPKEQDDVEKIHDELSEISISVVHTDCHGVKREEQI